MLNFDLTNCQYHIRVTTQHRHHIVMKHLINQGQSLPLPFLSKICKIIIDKHYQNFINAFTTHSFNLIVQMTHSTRYIVIVIG